MSCELEQGWCQNIVEGYYDKSFRRGCLCSIKLFNSSTLSYQIFHLLLVKNNNSGNKVLFNKFVIYAEFFFVC